MLDGRKDHLAANATSNAISFANLLAFEPIPLQGP